MVCSDEARSREELYSSKREETLLQPYAVTCVAVVLHWLCTILFICLANLLLGMALEKKTAPQNRRQYKDLQNWGVTFLKEGLWGRS